MLAAFPPQVREPEIERHLSSPIWPSSGRQAPPDPCLDVLSAVGHPCRAAPPRPSQHWPLQETCSSSAGIRALHVPTAKALDVPASLCTTARGPDGRLPSTCSQFSSRAPLVSGQACARVATARIGGGLGSLKREAARDEKHLGQ